MIRARYLFTVGFVAILGLVGWRVYERLQAPVQEQRRGSGPREVPVEVAPVERGPIELRRTFAGSLEARAEFVVSPKVGGRVEELFFAEIDRLKREPVTDAELEKAKRQIEVDLVNGQATNHAVAQRIARDHATFGRIRPLPELLEQIQAVSVEDVQRVAQTYLRPEQRSVIHVVPPPEAEE